MGGVGGCVGGVGGWGWGVGGWGVGVCGGWGVGGVGLLEHCESGDSVAESQSLVSLKHICCLAD